jgi:1,2-phenylacetyl-CoA epoxidase PaaB subunit
MSMGLAYDAAMSTLAALYKEGVVSKEDVEKAIEIARKFYVAYHAALDIYVVWLSTQSAEDSQRLKVAIEEAANFLGNLRTYISILRGGNK